MEGSCAARSLLAGSALIISLKRTAPWILQLLFEAPLIFSWATFTGPKLASPLRLQSQSQICALQTGLRVALALTTPILQNSTDCLDVNE